MDLTDHYLRFKLGLISQGDVVRYVDQHIQADAVDVDSVLELSLAGDLYSHDFERLMLPFVHAEKLTIGNIEPDLRAMIAAADHENAHYLINVLKTLLYDLELISWSDPFGGLYGRLDDGYDLITQGVFPPSWIAECCQEWLRKYPS